MSDNEELDEFFAQGVIHGLPMTTPACILAAMAIRLGGRVELTDVELTSVQGLMISKGDDGGLIIESNADPIHGVLSSSLLE